MIRLWDVDTGNIQKTLKIPDFTSTFYSIAFSPDGQTLASAGYDATIRLWDVDTGNIQKTLAGHTEEVNRVAFSSDGHTLVSHSLDGTVLVWDLR